MKKREAEAFHSWLMDQLPERILALENATHETEPLIKWKADYTPDSLRVLSEWFIKHVKMRPRTKEEIDKLEAGTQLKGILDESELALVTKSLVVDIGLYLGEVMRKQFPHTYWKQSLDDKRLNNYGRPVLAGFGKVPFDPIGLVTTIAYRIGDGKALGEDIFKVFAIWARNAMTDDQCASSARA
jgi:hypothetical protein